MNDNLIKKNYLKKTKLLNKYNKFYYDKSDPLISDQEYDKLKQNVFRKTLCKKTKMDSSN